MKLVSNETLSQTKSQTLPILTKGGCVRSFPARQSSPLTFLTFRAFLNEEEDEVFVKTHSLARSHGHFDSDWNPGTHKKGHEITIIMFKRFQENVTLIKIFAVSGFLW